jgi:RyR domain
LSHDHESIDTRGVGLPMDIAPLVETLAKHSHEMWASQRIADGWTWGETRDDARKKHPCLVPYDELPESEKLYDRNAATETLKAIVVLGYRIQQPRD